MTKFADLNLIKPLQRAIGEQGYQKPTPIQAKTIPGALQGHDILGCAQTGTGKTAAFALPILDALANRKLQPTPRQPLALVLSPTRELAIQIDDSFRAYGKFLKLRRALVYGGVGQSRQVNSMKKGVHILVATPGRLLDLMQQDFIRLNQLEIFVLDEADRMLDMGFLPDLKKIMRALPKKRQSLFFSATMPPKITQLASQLLHKPISINVTPKKSTSVKAIRQKVVMIDRTDKNDLLHSILEKPNVERAIVFTRTKRGANIVARRLNSANITSAPIHGNKSQNARQRALQEFRDGDIRVLVATDVAARGIDIEGVTHVVNFDMPVEPEAYVHRIGRTGRAGANGVAISFCTADERNELRDIEKLIGNKIPGSDYGSKDSARRKSDSNRKAADRPNRKKRHPSRRKSNDGHTTSPDARKRQKQRQKKRAKSKTKNEIGFASAPEKQTSDRPLPRKRNKKKRATRPGKNERNRRKKER